MRCWISNRVIPKREHGPVFAIWYYDQTGFSCRLCQKCLDGWLDNADDDPELEPTRLIFINT